MPDDAPASTADPGKLLEHAVAEEHYFLDAHQKRVTFYSSLISAVLVATVAGVMKADSALEYVLLLIGPAVVFALALLAHTGTFRFYQRFLEAVTVRAKLEQQLGLTQPRVTDTSENEYWPEEPFVATRHIRSRRTKTSEEFIKKYSRQGYQKPTVRLFCFFQCVAILLAALLVLAAITSTNIEEDNQSSRISPNNQSLQPTCYPSACSTACEDGHVV